MIKKLSLFFSRYLRERIKSEPKLLASPGMIAAMAFGNNLMRAVALRYMTDAEAKAIGGEAAWKFFDGCHAESGDMATGFKLAQRVEGIIALGYGETIELRLSFYKRGERDPFLTIEPTFIQTTGEIGCISYGSNPLRMAAE